MHFFLNMDPPTKTQQEHRVGISKNGKPYFYEDQDLKKARMDLRRALSRFVPDEPYANALRLTVKWLFPKKKHRDGEYKTTKPDTDNLNKMLKDEMTHLGFWKDDALVASEIIEKFWAEVPGIFINIEEITNG